jgi:hypothetical protein
MLTWRRTRERHGDAQERARPHAAAKQEGEATQGGEAEQAAEAEVEGKRPNGGKGWGIEVGGDRNMVFVPLVGCLGVSALTICEYLPILLPFVNIVCVRSYVSVLTICEYRLVISVWFTPNIACRMHDCLHRLSSCKRKRAAIDWVLDILICFTSSVALDSS